MDLATKHVVILAERIKKRCEQEGRDTFTMKMLREEKQRMYEGKPIGAPNGHE